MEIGLPVLEKKRVVKVTEWPPIGKIAAHSAYEMFSWYKYLIVSLVFSHLGFWSGSLFLIAPFPDLCLLVIFFIIYGRGHQFGHVTKISRTKHQCHYPRRLHIKCQRYRLSGVREEDL